MEYDYIIIGAGISGLYTAYLIKKHKANCKILILEANNYIGGRMGTDNFYSSKILTGAGIGRKKQDINLINLLKELKINYNEFTVNHNYASDIVKVDINKIMDELKDYYDKDKDKKPVNFKTFATLVLGEQLYKNFLINSGYRDYENEDAYSVLTDYHMEYNTGKWTGLYIPWDDLINRLVDIINSKNIKLNSTVTNINYLDKEVYVSNKKYYFKKIILATTIKPIQKLLKLPLYKQIKSQSFLRIYAKINTNYIDIMKEKVSINVAEDHNNKLLKVPTTLVVSSLLYKIIPINSDKGIYMIAYSDNKGADKLNREIDNKVYFETLLAKSININNNTIKIDKMKHYYWKEGTHYFLPYKHMISCKSERLELSNKNKSICKINPKIKILNHNYKLDFIKKAQNPKENVYVVGECISTYQGWVEGAISSVNNIIQSILENNII